VLCRVEAMGGVVPALGRFVDVLDLKEIQGLGRSEDRLRKEVVGEAYEAHGGEQSNGRRVGTTAAEQTGGDPRGSPRAHGPQPRRAVCPKRICFAFSSMPVAARSSLPTSKPRCAAGRARNVSNQRFTWGKSSRSCP